MSYAGRQHSEEYKAHMSQVAKDRWANRATVAEGTAIGCPQGETRRERQARAAREREMVKAMEAKGYESWRRAPNKKTTYLKLTPKGRAALEELMAAKGVLAEYGRSYYRGAVIEEAIIQAAAAAKKGDNA